MTDLTGKCNKEINDLWFPGCLSVSQGICEKCKPGFVLSVSQTCVTKGKGLSSKCLLASLDENFCAKCEETFYSNGPECIKCPQPGCLRCFNPENIVSQGSFICLECNTESGYFMGEKFGECLN